MPFQVLDRDLDHLLDYLLDPNSLDLLPILSSNHLLISNLYLFSSHQTVALRPATVAQIRFSHEEVQPRKWARWQDVPDEWVLPSKRWPDHPFYQTAKYKKYKKKQIFFQQNDGIPVWLKRGYPYMYIYWVMGVMFLISGYGAFSHLLSK